MVEFQVTEDGSHTLFSEMAGQTYHSSHGAVQESRHIFISQLSIKSRQLEVSEQELIDKSSLSVLEIGFGTGLNALLTAQWASESGVNVEYTTIELYPLGEEVYRELNYGRLLGDEGLFLQLHKADWDAGVVEVTENFTRSEERR
jgi:tRNA U34 5-methylaminomethyl-2-thiouridine-forming methyltransferase MnmC